MNINSQTRGKRHNFLFPNETDALLRKIAKETDMKFIMVIRRALESYAKEKGVSND